MGGIDRVSEREEDAESHAQGLLTPPPFSFSETPRANAQLTFHLKYSQMRKEFRIWLWRMGVVETEKQLGQVTKTG